MDKMFDELDIYVSVFSIIFFLCVKIYKKLKKVRCFFGKYELEKGSYLFNFKCVVV